MRTRTLLPLMCFLLAVGAAACGDDDTTAADVDTAATDDGTTPEDSAADDTEAANDGGDSTGGGTVTFQGVTYELDGAWCGSGPEGGRQWQGFDDENYAAEILIRDGGDPPRYTINLSLDDGEVWQFNVTGGSESDEAVAAAAAIEATDTSIRGEGLTVWPSGTDYDDQAEQSDTVDFDFSC